MFTSVPSRSQPPRLWPPITLHRDQPNVCGAPSLIPQEPTPGKRKHTSLVRHSNLVITGCLVD
ncbi:MAG: hypothetical protein NVS4B6_26370 [Mycobacterium sp.]